MPSATSFAPNFLLDTARPTPQLVFIQAFSIKEESIGFYI
tara:strand:- start:58 stop:177 length:120 start_codon:yes stop_codon:yes gene_type:complete